METEKKYVWLVWEKKTKTIVKAFENKENAEKFIIHNDGKYHLLRALLSDYELFTKNV